MPDPVAPKAPTLDEANAALLQLAHEARSSGLEAEPEPAPPEPEPSAAAPAAPVAADAEAEPASPDAAPVTDEPAPDDDVVSLRKRLETAEADRQKERERYEARLKAHQDRSTTNAQVMHQRYLRKSAAADRALKALKASRTTEGVAESVVDGVIGELEGTMNPASSSYVEPAPTATQASEDQIITLNNFLNEKAMTADEAAEFGNWVRSDGAVALTPQEQAVAHQSLDGFLRIAHTRWESARQKTLENKRNDAVGAVRSVQRTQREAARAAAAAPAAPRKQPTPQRVEVDPSKFTRDDISKLLRKSVEEAKRAEV